jgi:hypothetical protein
MRPDEYRTAGVEGGPSRRDLLRVVGGSLAVGAASGLAGCPTDEGLTDAEATPTVLHPNGYPVLGLTEVRVDELTRTVSRAGVGEVSLTSYLAVHGRPTGHDQPLPMRFGVPEPAAHALGVLAMPAPSALGQELNPLAEQPLREVLTGERGRQFLGRTEAVDTPDFEWASGPTRVATRKVETMGSATTAESYLGITAQGEDRRTVLTTLARVERDDEVVLLGEVLWRRTPLEPLDAEVQCTDDRCQLAEGQLSRIQDRFAAGGPYVTSCRELAGNLNADIGNLCSGTGVPDTGPRPTVGTANARIVQHVENTQVEELGSPTRVLHEEPDPDLVRGEPSAVVFEFDTLEHLDNMGSPLELAVFSGNSGSGGRYEREGIIEFSQGQLKRIESGVDTVAVLHEMSNAQNANAPTSNENPVFELETGRAKVAPVIDPLKDTSAVHATFTHRATAPKSVSRARPREIRDVAPLKVGFIPVRDTPTSPLNPFSNLDPGDRYGTANGMPRDPLRSFESATEYLQRAYPGDIVTYLHQEQPFPGRADDDDAIKDEMAKVKDELNEIATGTLFQQSNFPNGGTLRLDGRNRSRMVNEIRNNGFDVTVAIVPAIAANQGPNRGSGGYFPYHGRSWSGVSFGPCHAVVINGASASGTDASISSLVAQEVGHFFQNDYLDPAPDHPMAQRRDPDGPNKTVNGVPIDKDHARHRDSENAGVSNADTPGVVSNAYELQDGFANLHHYDNPNGNFDAHGPGETFDCGDRDGCQTGSVDPIEQVPSYMSYTGRNDRSWTDARIHQQLIGAGGGQQWDTGLAGSASARYMLAASGTVDEDGSVEYESVRAHQGVDRYVDDEDNPVTVAIEGPGGETLASARVPVTVSATHAREGEATPERPSFLLPFEPAGVRVRTTYDGRTTSMNPIARSVRDAIRRVPPRGFEGELEAARNAVDETLARIAALMADGAYGDAATVMEADVRALVQEVMTPYEAALDQRTQPAMLSLVDRMAEHLTTAADAG